MFHLSWYLRNEEPTSVTQNDSISGRMKINKWVPAIVSFLFSCVDIGADINVCYQYYQIDEDCKNGEEREKSQECERSGKESFWATGAVLLFGSVSQYIALIALLSRYM